MKTLHVNSFALGFKVAFFNSLNLALVPLSWLLYGNQLLSGAICVTGALQVIAWMLYIGKQVHDGILIED